jgi:hypothetical protein
MKGIMLFLESSGLGYDSFRKVKEGKYQKRGVDPRIVAVVGRVRENVDEISAPSLDI